MTVNIKGHLVEIDEEDSHFLNEYSWYVSPNGCGQLYVQTKGRGGYHYLHRLIMGAEKRQEIDHIDLNSLDNRKSNLRVCTSSQNKYNRPVRSNNTSGYKGVSWDKKSRKWVARIKEGRSYPVLGYFTDILEAHSAYKKAAVRIAGEFARW